MATVEIVATLAGATSNSYVTLEEAETYFSSRLNAEAWEEATDVDKAKALVTACRAIESLRLRSHRRVLGYPWPPPLSATAQYDPLRVLETEQALAFPRLRDYSVSENEYLIPAPVCAAQCEEALSLLSGGVQMDRRRSLQASGVQSFAVDGLSETYGAGEGTAPGAHTLSSALARSLMAPLMAAGGMIATSDNPDGELTPGSRP